MKFFRNYNNLKGIFAAFVFLWIPNHVLAGWDISSVDIVGQMYAHTSIALDTSNNPHISYYRVGGDLKYAKWTGTSWSTQTVNTSSGYTGVHTSITLDTSNNPHISYDDNVSNLKYAKWTGDSWSIQIVDSPHMFAEDSSIVLDTSNNPHISYEDDLSNFLKYAKWTGTSWSTQTVDSTGYYGGYTSIALDTSNNPHISYSATGGYNISGCTGLNYIKYAKWTGTSWSTQTVDSTGCLAPYTSIAIALDTSNNPHISYHADGGLKYAKWTGTSWSTQTVVSVGATYISIALDTSNNPHISYHADGGLKYAKWTGTSWSTQTVYLGGSVTGYHTSIALDTSNNPHISFDYSTDLSNGQIKYAKGTPTNPTGITSTPADNGIYSSTITLTYAWTQGSASDTDGIVGYYLQVGTNASTNDASLLDQDVGSVVIYNINVAQESKTYYARVKPRNVWGNYGNWSNWSDGITVDLTTVTGVPSTPTDSGIFASSSSLTFTWTQGTAVDSESGIAGYYLQVGDTVGGNNFFDEDVGNVLTKIISGASDGKTYYARVRAKNGSGLYGNYSDNSDGLTVDLTTVIGNPSTPTDSGIFTSSTSLTFTWTQGTAADAETGITSYYIQIGTQPAVNDASLFDGDAGNVFSKTINATDGNTYYARVAAKNGVNQYGDWSGWSDGITVDTTAPSAPTVTSLTHPDSTTPYLVALPIFNVTGPSDLSGIAGYYWKINGSSDTVPTATDTFLSTGTIQTETLLNDATWYFHVVAKDVAGNTGTAAAHYKFIVKTTIDPAISNTFQTYDGTKVEIPAETLLSPTQIIIQTPLNTPVAVSDSSMKLTSVAREIKLADGTAQFNKEIIITLPYSASDVAGMDEQSLRLFFYDDTNKLWILILNSTVDTVNRRVTGRVTHLTVFGIAQYSSPAAIIENLSNYPNPFSPLRGETTKIRYMLDENRDVRIRIYDPMGYLVWETNCQAGQNGGVSGPNEIMWDGKTGDGREVGMGSYICVVETNGKKQINKIGVK